MRDPISSLHAELRSLEVEHHAASWTVCERGDRPATASPDEVSRWRALWAEVQRRHFEPTSVISSAPLSPHVKPSKRAKNPETERVPLWRRDNSV